MKAAETSAEKRREALLKIVKQPVELVVDLELAPDEAEECVKVSYSDAKIDQLKWDDVLDKLEATGKLNAGSAKQVRAAVALAKAADKAAAEEKQQTSTIRVVSRKSVDSASRKRKRSAE
jgi:hypothetical protein